MTYTRPDLVRAYRRDEDELSCLVVNLDGVAKGGLQILKIATPVFEDSGGIGRDMDRSSNLV